VPAAELHPGHFLPTFGKPSTSISFSRNLPTLGPSASAFACVFRTRSSPPLHGFHVASPPPDQICRRDALLSCGFPFFPLSSGTFPPSFLDFLTTRLKLPFPHESSCPPLIFILVSSSGSSHQTTFRAPLRLKACFFSPLKLESHKCPTPPPSPVPLPPHRTWEFPFLSPEVFGPLFISANLVKFREIDHTVAHPPSVFLYSSP